MWGTILGFLVAVGVAGGPAEAQGIPIHRDRGMEVFLVACDGSTDPASATVLVDLKSDELRREAAAQLEALDRAPEEASTVARRVTTFLFGAEGKRWRIQREIFLGDGGKKLAETEDRGEGPWADMKPGSLPDQIWRAVETMKKNGVKWAVPPALYLPSGEIPGRSPSQDDAPSEVAYRDDRVYPLFREGGSYVWVELDWSECLMRQSDSPAPRALEAMERVRSFALARHLEDGRWRVTLQGETRDRTIFLPDEGAFLALEGFLREGLENRRVRRAHGDSSQAPLAAGEGGEGPAEMVLCGVSGDMNEEELLEVRWLGAPGKGTVVGTAGAWRYLADHLFLARRRWEHQQRGIYDFVGKLERLGIGKAPSPRP